MPMTPLDLEKESACEALATIFDWSDDSRYKDEFVETFAHDPIASFHGKAPTEVTLQDGWKMVDFLLEKALLLTDAAEVIKEHLPTRIEGDD